MSTPRKLLLLSVQEYIDSSGVALDLQRLCDALRARGAEVESLHLDAGRDVLLDRLDEGAMPIVFHNGIRA